jgi:O-antigen ligase
MEPSGSGLLTWTDVRTGGSIVVGGAVTAVLLVLAVGDAGFPKALWLPVAGFVVALALVVTLALPDVLRSVPAATLVAVFAFFAFAGWTFLSIFWADARADAWDAANRTLFYAALYALVALWPWRPSVGAGVLAGFAVGIALVGAATLSAAVRADELDTFFIGGLFAEPAGYHNANAALFLIAFWPALHFASRLETPVPLRPLLLASACLLLELALLSQSRGSLVAFPVSALVFFAVVSERLRAFVALAPVAAAAFLARDPLLDVFSAVRQGDGEAAVREAAVAVAVSVTAVAVAGLVLAVVDRKFAIPRRARVVAAAAVIAVCASAVLVGGVALAASDPVDRGRTAWANFKQYGPEQEQADRHFTSGLGSNRYDFWRVSLAEFADAPLHGIGADNFAVPYIRDRRSDEEPLYPHSFVLGVLSQTGLVGAALLAVFAAAAVRAASRATTAPHGRALLAVGLAAAAYFGVHAAGDWLWELPGVGALALVALALPAGAARAHPEPRERRAPAFLLVAVSVLTAVALVSFALPWLAARSIREAGRAWRTDPDLAYTHLDRARRLNPLSERPDLVAGAIAGRRGEWPRMRSSFERALERKPQSWYAELQLGVVDALERRPDPARAHLARARALNPRESVIGLVERRLASDAPLRPGEVDQVFLSRVEERIR